MLMHVLTERIDVKRNSRSNRNLCAVLEETLVTSARITHKSAICLACRFEFMICSDCDCEDDADSCSKEG